MIARIEITIKPYPMGSIMSFGIYLDAPVIKPAPEIKQISAVIKLMLVSCFVCKKIKKDR